MSLFEPIFAAASIDDLIAVKRLAGRAEDVQAIAALEKIREKRRS